MITAAQQGRHRYYHLAGHEIAAALEAIGSISTALPVRSLRQSREAAALSQARTCYDHLAGRAGVGLLDAMLSRGLLAADKSPGRTSRAESTGTRFTVTAAGTAALASFGVDLLEVRRSRRQFAGECIDWTQRRGHLNGALGAAIAARLFELAGSPPVRAAAACWSPRRARRAWRTPSGSTCAGRSGRAVASCRSCERSWWTEAR